MLLAWLQKWVPTAKRVSFFVKEMKDNIKYNESKRKWYLKNKETDEYKEKHRLNMRNYRLKEKNKDTEEKYRLKNQIKIKEYRKENYKKNRDIFIKNWRNYTMQDFGLKRKYIAMVSRCKYSSNPKAYKYYFLKGIVVIWSSYEDFKNDMYESYLEHLHEYGFKETSLDRIDNNGNYCKENCRWATKSEQAKNRSYPQKIKISTVM